MKIQSINREIPSKIDITYMVPCLNEEESIEDAIVMMVELSKARNLTFEIIVIDDCSEDRSVEIVKSVQKRFPGENILLYENEVRRGLARNYHDGAYLGTGKYYMCIMGDNPHPRKSIAGILDLMGKADIIVPVFGDQDNRTFMRKKISLVFTWMVNLISGYRLRYYNGIALHRRFNVMRWHSDTDGFAYHAEILVRLLQEGCTYREIEVINHDRSAGVSTALNYRNFLSVGHALIQILLRRIRYRLFYKKKSSAAAKPIERDRVASL